MHSTSQRAAGMPAVAGLLALRPLFGFASRKPAYTPNTANLRAAIFLSRRAQAFKRPLMESFNVVLTAAPIGILSPTTAFFFFAFSRDTVAMPLT